MAIFLSSQQMSKAKSLSVSRLLRLSFSQARQPMLPNSPVKATSLVQVRVLSSNWQTRVSPRPKNDFPAFSFSVRGFGGLASSLKSHKPRLEQNSVTSRMISLTIILIVGFSSYAIYEKITIKTRRKDAMEPIPKDVHIKANLPLVRYCGCVLSEDMVLSGLMEKIESFELRPDDIVVASFPKSGTTWLQEVVYRLCHVGIEDPYPNNDDVLESRFPYLEYAYPGLKEISERKTRRFLKTHLPFHLLPKSVTNSGSKVLYIYRNPKDVAISYFYFAKMLYYIQYTGSLNRFIRNLFVKDRVPYSPYFVHVRDYLKVAEAKPDRFLAVCYEDMQEDPQREIRRIAEFLGVKEVSTTDIEALAKDTSFEAMKSNPRTNYKHWDAWGIRDKKKTEFFRKGIVGDYANHNLEERTKQSLDEWIKTGEKDINIKFRYSI